MKKNDRKVDNNTTSSSSSSRCNTSNGIPFSVEYLTSLAETHIKTFHQSEMTSDIDNFASCASFDNVQCLIAPTLVTDLYITGACSITLLRGSCVLNGFALSIGVRKDLVVSGWIPAAKLVEKKVKSKNSNEKISSLLQKYVIASRFTDMEILESTFASSSSLVLIESYEGSGDWMVQAEDISSRIRALLELNAKSVRENKGKVAYISTAIIGCAYDLKELSVDLQTIPASWSTSVDDVLSSKKTDSQRVIICGAKGVGKSTCLRYALNRLLGKYKSVAVIDCDVGQPEFSVPGTVSLHIIQDPILSSPHLNLHRPDRAYFIGTLICRYTAIARKRFYCNFCDTWYTYRRRFYAQIRSISRNSRHRASTCQICRGSRLVRRF